jgi:type II secretory pathway pseudopilin PulG
MMKRSGGRGRDVRGFSLLESLISLVIFFLIFVGSLEFFGTVRMVFYRLQSRQENRQAAWAALDKIRIDVLAAGQGLARPMRLGLLAAFEQIDGRWVLVRAEASPALSSDPRAGQTTLVVAGTDEGWAGRTVCLYDKTKGENAIIQSSENGILTLSLPLQYDYRASETAAAVLRTTVIYLDAGQNILRRKIDSSPAQPLLEDVHSFALYVDSRTCLADARLALASEPEESYALKILARNASLGKPF